MQKNLLVGIGSAPPADPQLRLPSASWLPLAELSFFSGHFRPPESHSSPLSLSLCLLSCGMLLTSDCESRSKISVTLRVRVAPVMWICTHRGHFSSSVFTIYCYSLLYFFDCSFLTVVLCHCRILLLAAPQIGTIKISLISLMTILYNNIINILVTYLNTFETCPVFFSKLMNHR